MLEAAAVPDDRIERRQQLHGVRRLVGHAFARGPDVFDVIDDRSAEPIALQQTRERADARRFGKRVAAHHCRELAQHGNR